MAYIPDAACFKAADAAAGGRLDREAINAAFERIDTYRRRLVDAGQTTGMAERLRRFADSEGERTRVAAAMQRRHAALNVLVRDKLDQAIDGFVDAGLSPKQAILAIFEGSQKGARGARDSVATRMMANEGRYLGGIMSEIERERPHLRKTLRDQALDEDIMREMIELRKDGKPGITGNEDARFLAKTFHTYLEMARTDLNNLGAAIGKLDGYAGPQIHDDIKLIAAGKSNWISSILPKLDIERTFPEGLNEVEAVEALGRIYDTIITGFDEAVSPAERGVRVNPANLAKSLGKSRVLHFRDADTALAYREEFGFGNTVSGIVHHLRRSARLAANMETLGPNPGVMFEAVVEGLKRRIKASTTLADDVKAKQISQLGTDAGALRQALDISTGLASRPVDVTAARIGNDIRALQSMSKLGAATITAFGDTMSAGAASSFRGGGFWRGISKQIGGMMRGRAKGEQTEIAYLLGEGFDGLLGNIIHPTVAQDGPVGFLSKLQERYFRFNLLSPWTDTSRAVAARVASAEMGMRAKTSFGDLPDVYRHVLGLHNIGEPEWNAIRSAPFRGDNGRDYITPDLMRLVPDEALEALVPDRIEAARARLTAAEQSRAGRSKGTKANPRVGDEQLAKLESEFRIRRAKIIDTARRDLELRVGGFFADEAAYAVVEVDAASRRFIHRGQRPGTFTGELLRYIMQFKGFPITFAQRVWGRAIYGHRPGAGKMEKAAHIGQFLAGMTMAGYMSMTMKDILRGYWPPRDPADYRTILSAATQGGAFGLYGDFLFSQRNRFGGGLLESAVGPSIGSFFDAIEIGLQGRDFVLSGGEDKLSAARAINVAIGTTPYLNLFYVRPSMDLLWINSLREAASPGYLLRQERRRLREYGQRSFLPRTLAEVR